MKLLKNLLFLFVLFFIGCSSAEKVWVYPQTGNKDSEVLESNCIIHEKNIRIDLWERDDYGSLVKNSYDFKTVDTLMKSNKNGLACVLVGENLRRGGYSLILMFFQEDGNLRVDLKAVGHSFQSIEELNHDINLDGEKAKYGLLGASRLGALFYNPENYKRLSRLKEIEVASMEQTESLFKKELKFLEENKEMLFHRNLYEETDLHYLFLVDKGYRPWTSYNKYNSALLKYNLNDSLDNVMHEYYYFYSKLRRDEIKKGKK